jgi:hypothetical protein
VQEYKFTLVFGKVIEGFDKLLEVSRIKVIFLHFSACELSFAYTSDFIILFKNNENIEFYTLFNKPIDPLKMATLAKCHILINLLYLAPKAGASVFQNELSVNGC